MNKYYLPAIASLLILAITATSVLPVLANGTFPTRATAVPALLVVTIPEDDEVHKTGIMLMSDGPGGINWGLSSAVPDLMAQFKLLVSYNGVPVYPDSFFCQVIEKDKSNPLKDRQFPTENLRTSLVWMDDFACKIRWAKPGVGVIDVYYLGDLWLPERLADYILVVGFDLTVSRTVIYGTEMQDICLLGWPEDITGQYTITKPGGDYHVITPNPFGAWDSCEDIALYQKHFVLGLPVPWT
jgi:hypothetical protein